MLQHVIGMPFSQHSTVVQDTYPVGEIGHHLHIMLDPDHRDSELVFDAQDETREVLSLIAVQSGGWLVKQQQRRLKRECARETDDLLCAERQTSNTGVAIALKLDEIDDFFRRLALAQFLPADAGQEQHFGEWIGAGVRMPADQQILQNRHLWKQFAVLERARNSELCDIVWCATADILAAEADRALAAINSADAI